jgi:hypothetical protein
MCYGIKALDILPDYIGNAHCGRCRMCGEPKDEMIFFHWDSIRLNLPGNNDYDPSLPWFFKVGADGTLAADFFLYDHDNNQATGNTKK